MRGRRRLGAGARPHVVGRSRSMARSPTATPIRVSKVQRVEDAQLCYERLQVVGASSGSATEFDALAKRAWRTARASATSGATCSSPKARPTSRSSRSSRSGISPPLPRDRRGGRRRVHRPRRRPHGRRRRPCVSTNGVLHDEVLAALRPRDAGRVTASTEITVGIDIGTCSVKAIAADEDGNVVASSRIPHDDPDPRARTGSSTTPRSRGTTARVAALAALQLDLAARGVSASPRWSRRSPPSTPTASR